MEDVEGSGGGGVAFKRDWTKGNITRNLVSLAWPMIVTESLYMVTVVDMIWVGKLGAASIAGVGVASIVTMLIMVAKLGLIAGVRATVARFAGAGDTGLTNHAAGQALVIGVVWGLVMTAIGVFLAEPIVSVFGVEADVIAEGAAYLRIFSLSWVPLSCWWIMMYSMQAAGDSATPMRVEFFTRFLYLVFCPFLVFGWWIFPRLGVVGIATSNLVVESLGMVIGVWILSTGRTRLRLTWRDFRLDLKVIWGMVKIGIPALVMSIQTSFASMVLMWIIAPFGTLAVAAHSLCNRIQLIVGLPNLGVNTAVGVLVGQNLGAGQPERAERSGWMAAGLIEVFMLICSLVVLLWAESIMGIFSRESSLVEMGSAFLRIAAAGYLVMGFSGALRGAISGAGDTVPPMIIGLVNMWLVHLPLAYFIPRITKLGVYGVRWAGVVSLGVGAVAITAYFRLGRWKRKEI